MRSFCFIVLAAGLASGCDRTITVSAVGASLVAAQDADGDWRPLTLDDAGEVSFDVSGDDYGFAYVCPAGPTTPGFAAVRLATVDDPEPVVRCVDPRTVTLVGTTAPRAWVFAAGDGLRADQVGRFQLQVVPGRHDVVVLADSVDGARATIVRDLDLTTGRTVDLPVAPDWTAVAHVPWPVTVNAPNQTLYLVTRTCSGTDFWFSGGSYTYQLAGSGLLGDCDGAAYGLREDWGGQNRRYAEVPQAVGAPNFVLPEPNHAATVDRILSWDGTWDELTLQLWSAGLEYSATAGRFRNGPAGSTVELVDVTALPGWQPDMPGLDPGVSAAWMVRTQRGTEGRDRAFVDAYGTLRW